MDVLITYDLVEGKQTEVKDAMKAMGYYESFTYTDALTQKKETCYLPNTSLWKPATTATQAKADLFTCVNNCKSKLERLFTTKFESWACIPGVAYKR